MREITLKIFYSKKEQDFVVQYPAGKSTGGYVITQIISKRTISRLKTMGTKDLWNSEKVLYSSGDYNFIEHDFIKEMENRGFDIKTLKFSIKLDSKKLEKNFPEIYKSLSIEDKRKLGI